MSANKSKSSLSTQVLTIMLPGFLVVIIPLLFIFAYSTHLTIKRHEEENIENQTNMAITAIKSYVKFIPPLTREWAQHDYVYSYITKENTENFEQYVEELSAFEKEEMNALIILDDENNPVYEKFYKHSPEDKSPNKEDLEKIYTFLSRESYSSFQKTEEALNLYNIKQMGVSGFVAHESKIYYLSAFPVINKNKEQVYAGTFILARIIDDAENKELSNIIGIDFKLRDISQLEFNQKDLKTLSEEGSVVIKEKSTAGAYKTIEDIYGQKNIVVKTISNRTIYKESMYIVFFVLAISIIICALNIMLVLKNIRKNILKPITNLTLELAEITGFERGGILVRENNSSFEMAGLTQNINHMLGRLEEDRKLIKTKSENLYYNANFDILTGLRNRASATEVLDATIKKAERENKNLTVFYLDIDRFKYINDAIGFLLADELMVALANRIKANFNNGEVIARIKGDEFIICVYGLRDKADDYEVAAKIMDMYARPFKVQNREIDITTSLGSATFPGDGQSTAELLKNAEMALHHAKETGKGVYVSYRADLQEKLQRKLLIEDKLRIAIHKGCNEFELHFQPKYCIQSGNIEACEALLRWNLPDEGKFYPDEFIPQAEESGLIVPLTWWILEECAAKSKLMRENGIDIPIAVNIPSQVLSHERFLHKIEEINKSFNGSKNKLDIEITERTLLEDVEVASDIFKRLHEMGMEISVDDFGTGYSSLSYLNKLAVDRIKIDRSFVIGIEQGEDMQAIVKAIIAMSEGLKIIVTAEGVEEKHQYDFLKENGCDEIQGYLISKPKNIYDFIDFCHWFSKNKPSGL